MLGKGHKMKTSLDILFGKMSKDEKSPVRISGDNIVALLTVNITLSLLQFLSSSIIVHMSPMRFGKL